MRAALYLPSLEGGGIERLYLGLADQWTRAGHGVTLVINEAHGALAGAVPPGVEVHALGARRQATSVPALVRYLRKARPDVVMSGHDHNNIMLCTAALAKPGATKIVVSQHNSMAKNASRGAKFAPVPYLYRALFGRAAAVVAVSSGVADDLAALCGIERARIDVIHNGIVPADIEARARAETAPGIFEPGLPTILAVGRMTGQKDFATLLKAFALLRQRMEARLVILGEGPLRGELEALARDLGIAADTVMPGFVDNPFAHMRRAALFVLSSRHEGFGNVIAEALACGTPVVATDCPHGPSEILEGGRYGRLVPVGDASALAGAMAASLGEPADRAALAARGMDFTEAACATRYLALFSRLTGIDAGCPPISHDKEVA